MTEPGAVNSNAPIEKLKAELLVEQRKELQFELKGIDVRLRQAELSGTDSQVLNLESAREARDNIVAEIDRIDQILAKQNPNVLSEQAAGLPMDKVIEEDGSSAMILPEVPEDEPMDPNSPIMQVDPSVIDGKGSPEIVEIPKTEQDPITKLDEKLRSLYERKNEVLEQYTSDVLDATTKRDEGLVPINVDIETALKKKLAYVQALRRLEEAKKDLQ